MNIGDRTKARAAPSVQNLEAAAWIARLQREDRTPAVDAACQEWLNADPRNRAAFEAANKMWEHASTLPISISARVGRARRKPQAAKFWRVAVACSMLAGLALIGAWAYQQRSGILETSTGQQLVLPLQDGSRVTLNTDTTLKLQFTAHERRVVLESGEALFEVAPSAARPFIVRAGEREVTALGTQFLVRYDETQTAVTLVEGKVSVEAVSTTAASDPPRAASLILHPGERLTFDALHRAAVDRPTLDKVIAWKRGQVAFENTPLATAIEEMNRYSPHKLSLAGSAAADLPVSGLFRTGDSDNFVLALTSLYPLRVVERDGRTVIESRDASP
jgi:transmembrane sensor